jgi:hypothetical protein
MSKNSGQGSGSNSGRRRLALGLLGVAALLALVGGCTRRFFRQFADREVDNVLAEKDRYPQWKIEEYHVYPDPRARFADPTNPDRPPMPPDDPAAWKLSPHPQHPGHPGVGWVEGDAYVEILRRWDEENRAKNAEEEKQAAASGKRWRYLAEEMNEIGVSESPYALKPFLIGLEQAVELGLINSREYQNFREELYEEALPVTAERFSFAWQWAAMEDAVRQWAGPKSLEGQQNNWNLGSTASFSKLFSTGALLTFNFANTTVFNFLSFARGTTSQSTINLDFVQPLLRGGGRAVTLEPLTQAERNLVYAIRAFARFREEYYLSICLGSNLPGSLGSAAGTGATTAGSVLAVGGGPISILASLGLASTDVSGVFRGYLPTLFRELDMAADRKYVRDLERARELFEGFEEGGQFAPLQVDRIRSTLLGARNTVLVDLQNVTNSLDQLKLQLGLPMSVPLVLDDSPARPITRQLDHYYEVIDQSEIAVRLIEKQDGLPAGKLRAFLLNLYTTTYLVQGTPFQKKLPASWAIWAKTSDKGIAQRMEKLADEHRRLLDLKTDLEVKRQKLPAAEAQRLRDLEFEGDLGNLEIQLRRFETRPWAKKVKGKQTPLLRTTLFRLTAYMAESVLVWARNDRLDQLRQRWPELPPAPVENLDVLTADVEQAQEVAVQVALRNRLDLMNAQAQVVDAWRQLAVTANALQGVLNLHYHLDSTTPPGGSHPLAFSAASTNQELMLQPQLPLVRLVERNDYRAALINYQVARRSLMSVEDNIANQVRFDVRQLQLFAANYKIQQEVVELLYSQMEDALEVLIAPPEPPAAGARAGAAAASTTGAANAAALSNQYLQALGGVNANQTKMYDIWLSYLATRMQLYLDLEMLSLDSRGVWRDERATGSEPSPAPTPGQPSGQPTDGRPAPGEPLPPPRLLPPPQAAAVE